MTCKKLYEPFLTLMNNSYIFYMLVCMSFSGRNIIQMSLILKFNTNSKGYKKVWIFLHDCHEKKRMTHENIYIKNIFYFQIRSIKNVVKTDRGRALLSTSKTSMPGDLYWPIPKLIYREQAFTGMTIFEPRHNNHQLVIFQPSLKTYCFCNSS